MIIHQMDKKTSSLVYVPVFHPEPFIGGHKNVEQDSKFTKGQ